VRSDPGPTGGYLCQVSLADVSVLEVIEAVEGATDVGRCVVADRPCRADDVCVLHEAWSQARTELVGVLRSSPMSGVGRSEPGGAVA
jgi:DNA-binding IscR family transcriptional regulator